MTSLSARARMRARPICIALIAATACALAPVQAGGVNPNIGHLTGIHDRSGDTAYSYDLFGHVTEKRQTLANGFAQQISYTYLPNGLLASIDYPGGGVLAYYYDNTGRLTELDWNGQPLVTKLSWNPMGQPLSWRWAFASPNLFASRSYDTAARLAAVINGQIYAVHSDHLNTPRRIDNASGQTVWQWAYSAFGDDAPTTAATRFTGPNTVPATGATTATPIVFNLRFPGQYYDAESGLHYNGKRSYRPGDGGYTQADPIGLNGGWNGRTYVDGNPLQYTDPDGLQAVVPSPLGPVVLPIPAPPAGLPPSLDPENPHGLGALPSSGLQLPSFTVPGMIAKACGALADWMLSGDVTKRPSRVRKGTEQGNWDNARDGADGGKLCPTCGTEVSSQPGARGKDWDNDHVVPWRDRDLTSKDRQGVLDEYNRDTRLRCVTCNRSDNGK